MLKKISGVFITIKSRLYLSLFVLVLLFIINGIITLVVLNSNKELSNKVSTLIDPAAHALTDFNKLLIESKMLSINWVFIRANKEDKDALRKEAVSFLILLLNNL